MRVPVFAILFTVVSCGVVCGQGNPPTPLPAPQAAPTEAAAAPQSAPQPETESDRFPIFRENADRLRGDYEELDKKNMAEVDKLTRTKRCQINRIGPLLDRSIAAMHDWVTAEKKYWEVWGDAEKKRVDNQQATLASMQAELERVANLQESEKQDHLELQRRKAGLEQTKRTEEIGAQIDGLIKDIQDSEARLADAQQQFDSLTAQITNMRALISARLVGIRQNLARVDAWESDMISYYEKARAAANEFCNTKKPDERSTPLPKKPASN
ncbi:MAG: hypothetical protein ABSG65_01875 [Bryobacteraceae bacterium]